MPNTPAPSKAASTDAAPSAGSSRNGLAPEPPVNVARTKPKKKNVGAQIMPVSPGRSPNVARIDLGSTYRHPDLAPGGLAKAGREAHNIAKYGYTCIQEHYIQGPADLPQIAMAAMWNVHETTLNRWIREFGWAKSRQERLSETSVLHGGTLADDAVKLARDDFLARETVIVNAMLDNVEAAIKEIQEDVMSPTGEVKSVKKRAATRRTEVMTAKIILEHARMALGLRTKPGIFDGASIDARSITIVNETRPPEAETRSYVAQTLEEILSPDEILAIREPEISEGQVAETNS